MLSLHIIFEAKAAKLFSLFAVGIVGASAVGAMHRSLPVTFRAETFVMASPVQVFCYTAGVRPPLCNIAAQYNTAGGESQCAEGC